MIGLLCFVLAVLASPFKSKLRLEAENAVLRHQLIVLRRRLHGHVRLTNHDRWFFIQLYRWFPSILQVLKIIRPETLVRWHRAGFRRYWRWRSRPLGGRPQIETELRTLIRQMSIENPLWRATHPRRTSQAWVLRSLNQASPSTWSNGEDHQAKGGGLFSNALRCCPRSRIAAGIEQDVPWACLSSADGVALGRTGNVGAPPRSQTAAKQLCIFIETLGDRQKSAAGA